MTVWGWRLMLGTPLMRRGSLTLTTVPVMEEPTGMIVRPLSMTASVTRPEKLSPGLLVAVVIIVSRRILMAVPTGRACPVLRGAGGGAAGALRGKGVLRWTGGGRLCG